MRALFAALCALTIAVRGHGAGNGGYDDPIASVALWLVVILLAAKLGVGTAYASRSAES